MGDIILDYMVESSIIIRVPKGGRGRQKKRSEPERVQRVARTPRPIPGFESGRKGPQPKEWGKPLEAATGKGTDFVLEPQERNTHLPRPPFQPSEVNALL